ncbi:hypothetical protein [Vibrio parahaemolyticus]|jgi:hypothetical protein|uniref:hypothetical protein n=1 Tax=Vibrio parahaemolyticus TaxID=670 RepID=UPI00236112CC|nr:hypothetical protein [Vibrio parahaemolyticus]
MDVKSPRTPKGFVKAEIYGVLPERDSHIGICLLTENNEKLRFFVTKQDIELISIGGFSDTPDMLKPLEVTKPLAT